MRVMVNRNQFFDNMERVGYESGMDMTGTWCSTRESFEEMEVTMEELGDLIDKGYGIKINC